MVPLDPAAAWFVRSWLGPPGGPGLLALYHALVYRTPGLWGDDPRSPRSVILLRVGDGRIEAFGAGEAEPAVGWLVGFRRGFALHAPDDWHAAVRDRVGAVAFETVETWAGPAAPPPRPAAGARPGAVVRRLAEGDAERFATAAPAWGLRGWRSFPALIGEGAAFGVPHGPGFAALAWVFDRAEGFDALGVYTAPRFRRLGLGRAAASALVRHVVRDRDRVPLWSTRPDNEPSRALARALGFSVAAEETLVCWPSRDGDEGEG
jgi:RimJ/RimL family protein N-acetyltransferase